MKNTFSISASLLMLIFIAASCASTNDVASNKLIQKRKHLKGYHISSKQSKFNKSKLKQESEEFLVMENSNQGPSIALANELRHDSYKVIVDDSRSNDLEQDNSSIVGKTKNENTSDSETAKNEVTELAIDQNNANTSSKKQKLKLLKNKLKSPEKSDNSADDTLILLVILCFLLPPIAVGLKAGWDSTKFIISIILTLLFWVPGVIYGLLVVFDVI